MFEFLWKNKSAQNAVDNSTSGLLDGEKPAAPGTKLHYDQNLIPQFLSDHRKLLSIFGDIIAAMKQKNAGLVKEKMSIFGDELNGHLLKENIRFYVYLQHNLKNDPESIAIMHEFRKEMQHIGKAVVDFLRKYTEESDWSDAVWQNFQQEISGIGKVLTKRIQTEENTLYPLYLPPQDYR